jgi:hypothetical protein
VTDNEQTACYFDFGEITGEDTAGELDGPFPSQSRLKTREYIESQGGGNPFGLIVEDGSAANIHGVEKFTQDIVTAFLAENESFSPKNLDKNDIADLEIEFERIAQNDRRTASVDSVAVDPSRRSYADELEVSIDFTTENERYSTEFFLGDADTINAAG